MIYPKSIEITEEEAKKQNGKTDTNGKIIIIKKYKNIISKLKIKTKQIYNQLNKKNKIKNNLRLNNVKNI